MILEDTLLNDILQVVRTKDVALFDDIAKPIETTLYRIMFHEFGYIDDTIVMDALTRFWLMCDALTENLDDIKEEYSKKRYVQTMMEHCIKSARHQLSYIPELNGRKVSLVPGNTIEDDEDVSPDALDYIRYQQPSNGAVMTRSLALYELTKTALSDQTIFDRIVDISYNVKHLARRKWDVQLSLTRLVALFNGGSNHPKTKLPRVWLGMCPVIRQVLEEETSVSLHL